MARKYQLHGAFPSKAGDSAYEVALKNGFVGTEQEWLDSLEGKQGPQGPAGKDAESVDLSGLIETPETAVVGQTIVVKEVDENGKPTEWEAVDFPSGGDASQYRHIATIVFDSPLGGWKVEQDEDGNTFSLSHVFIRGNLTASPNGKSDGYIKLNCVAAVPWVFSADTGDYKAVMEITMVGTNASMRYMSWGTAIKATRVEEYCYDSSESVITSIQHYTAAYPHGSGSKFEIWGY